MSDKEYHPIIAIKLPTFYAVVCDKRVTLEGENVIYTAEGDMEAVNKLGTHIGEQRMRLIDQKSTPWLCAKEAVTYGRQHYKDNFTEYSALIAGFDPEQHGPQFVQVTKCDYSTTTAHENYFCMGFGEELVLSFFYANYHKELTVNQVVDLLDKASSKIARLYFGGKPSPHRTTIVKHYNLSKGCSTSNSEEFMVKHDVQKRVELNAELLQALPPPKVHTYIIRRRQGHLPPLLEKKKTESSGTSQNKKMPSSSAKLAPSARGRH